MFLFCSIFSIGIGRAGCPAGELHSVGGVFRATILKFTWIDWFGLEHGYALLIGSLMVNVR